MPVTIAELASTVAVTPEHTVPAMKDGATVKVTLAQIAAMASTGSETVTEFGMDVLSAADAPAGRSVLGLGTAATRDYTDFVAPGDLNRAASFVALATTFAYTVEPDKLMVTAGDVVEVPFLGSYEVLDSSATECDLDFTGSGGVKLNVRQRDGAWYAADFGAVGGGADDTIPVQKAINKGGLVRIHKHRLTAGVTFGTKTTIEGFGYDISGLYLDVGVDNVVLSSTGTGLEDVTLKDFTISGEYENVDRIKDYHGLLVSDVDRLTISGLRIIKTKEFAAVIRRCTGFLISGNRAEVSGINRDGFKLLSSRGGVFCFNNVKSGDDCVSVSGEANDTGDVVIASNHLRSDYARAVYINTTQLNPGPVGDVVVIGNVIPSTDSTAIVAELYEGEEALGRIIITKNVIHDFGLKVNNENGRLEAVRVTGLAGYPIKNVLIDGNMITVNGAPTTSVAKVINVTFAENVAVVRNMITCDQVVAAESTAIQIGSLDEPVTDFTADGNIIDMKGNGSYGINISRAKEGSVSNNKIKSAVTAAIRGIGDVTNPCTEVDCKNNKIRDPLGVMQRAIVTSGTSDDWTIEGNNLKEVALTSKIQTVGSNNTIRNNKGWRTSNSGTATITSAATEVSVSHGLSITPTIGNISITPSNTASREAGFSVEDITGGTFKIKVTEAPGSNATYGWSIRD